MVGSDGRVYEGAGYNIANHTSGNNVDSICISFIGDFRQYEAPPQQLSAAKRFLEDAVHERNLDAAYKLYGQGQLVASESPGTYLNIEIRKWDHWAEV